MHTLRSNRAHQFYRFDSAKHSAIEQTLSAAQIQKKDFASYDLLALQLINLSVLFAHGNSLRQISFFRDWRCEESGVYHLLAPEYHGLIVWELANQRFRYKKQILIGIVWSWTLSNGYQTDLFRLSTKFLIFCLQWRNDLMNCGNISNQSTGLFELGWLIGSISFQ